MGEVYRASDLRLERSAAIKVLPAHHPVTPSVRARFEHEAKSISALQHPKPTFQTVVFFPGDGGIFLRNLSLPATSSLDAILRSGRAVLHPVYKGTLRTR
jgi:serine/threonine protein kinase